MEVGDDAVVVGLVAALVAEPKNHKKKKSHYFHHSNLGLLFILEMNFQMSQFIPAIFVA